MSQMALIRVPVRELASFALRRGNLECGPVGPSARQGQQAHRRLQDDSTLEAEITLTRAVLISGRTVVLSGRLDLLDRQAHRLIEIKSTLVPRERLLPGRRALDRSQLSLYGWLWAGRDDADPSADPVPTLELDYIDIRSGRLEIERWLLDPVEIDGVARKALHAWVLHVERREARRRALVQSASRLAFPHDGFREGQRHLSVSVYRALRDGKSSLLQAPTGTGKTLGVLYPAIRVLGEGSASRLCWLTAKNSGRGAVLEALRQLVAQGLVIDALQVRARRQSCFCERDPTQREPDGTCPWSIGFHDRLPAARDAALGGSASDGKTLTARLLDGETIDRLAHEHRICPHALSLELMSDASVIVCDLNHLFDPVASLPLLNDEARTSVALIDEAHNLPERARRMFSAAVSRLDCLDARAHCLVSHPGLARALDALARALSRVARADQSATAAGVADALPASLPAAVARVLDANAEIASEPQADGGPLEFEFVAGLQRFCIVAERFGDAHRLLVDASMSGRRRDVHARLVCLDARGFTGPVLGSLRASVSFSAALGPLDTFGEALGLGGDTVAFAMPSPFDPAHLHCQMIDWIPMRYAEREASLPALLELIETTVTTRQGHYLVFLPSHAWLCRVADSFASRAPTLEQWRQVSGADAGIVHQQLARLDRSGTTVGFVITGGVFGEGVDYAGERLIGAIIVGTGLPPPDRESTLMIEHHRVARRPGYDLVCRHPALIRVLQSAGRVIRTANDRGVLLLVDSRFGDSFYTRERPALWNPLRPADALASRRALIEFWAAQTTSPDAPAGGSGVSAIDRPASFDAALRTV